MESLAEEVREKIHSLVKKGYSPSLIEGWIKEAVSPGGLTITTDYRILLTESGKEIVMRPLEKRYTYFFSNTSPAAGSKSFPSITMSYCESTTALQYLMISRKTSDATLA